MNLTNPAELYRISKWRITQVSPEGKNAVQSVNGCVVLVKTPQAVEILPNRKIKKDE